MRQLLWVAFDNKCFIDEKSNHENCPPGENSWCKWRVAETKGELADFHHKPALTASVREAIRPVYEALSSDGKMTTKTSTLVRENWSKKTSIRIAAYITSGIFNEGYSSKPYR